MVCTFRDARSGQRCVKSQTCHPSFTQLPYKTALIQAQGHTLLLQDACTHVDAYNSSLCRYEYDRMLVHCTGKRSRAPSGHTDPSADCGSARGCL